MNSLTEARSIIAERVKPRTAIRCPLAQAVGHVLASPVRSDRDIPASHRSAMDGYAFLHGDGNPISLKLEVRGEIPAGVSPSFALHPGDCARIFTGATVPEGSDTVVMQEDTTAEDDNHIRIQKVPEQGANILQQGENARMGAELVSPGAVLSAVQIGLCAAVGYAELDVIPRPRIAVLTTGEELLDVSETAASHQIRDSNGPMIVAQLQIAGFKVGECSRGRDTLADITNAAQRMLASADVLLITGGVSVGKYDLVPEALLQLGAIRHLHGIALRPGKPQLFATLGTDKYIFGLPGNPLSVLVGLHELVLPTLRKLSGFPADACQPNVRAKILEPLKGRKGQHHFLPARLTWTQNGPEARVIPGHGSADLVSASQANGFLVVPPDAQVALGDWLDFRPWGVIP